jgi:hypothetical protein
VGKRSREPQRREQENVHAEGIHPTLHIPVHLRLLSLLPSDPRGVLQASGFCPSASDKNGAGPACRKFPVVAGQLGGRLEDPLEAARLRDTAIFLNKATPASALNLAHAAGWFW